METGRKKVRLGELLVNSGVITAEQLQQALDNPNRQGKKLGEFLVDEGIVSEDFGKELEEIMGTNNNVEIE